MNRNRRIGVGSAIFLLGTTQAAWGVQDSSSQPAPRAALDEIRKHAAAVQPLLTTKLARQFADAAADLPAIAPRTLYFNTEKTTYYTEEQRSKLLLAEPGTLKSRTFDEYYYYMGRYGTPLAYSRPIDILAQAGFDDVSGKRIADFGYGSCGQLRMLAGLGADVVGIEVDPLLPALYSQPGDQGAIKGASGKTGKLTLVSGRFPADEATKAAVGDGYDLFISKNTLKNGYIHPAQPVDERKLVKLGVDDETFVRTLHTILKPGGRVLIYNLCPAPAPPDKPYIPWADGRCPFPRELWEKAGFRVVAFDVNDDAPARKMGRALGWDQGEGAMNLDEGLFGIYTLIEKPK